MDYLTPVGLGDHDAERRQMFVERTVTVADALVSGTSPTRRRAYAIGQVPRAIIGMLCTLFCTAPPTKGEFG